MKSISYDLEEGDKSGRHKFISRLKPCLKSLGYEIAPTAKKPYVHLFVSKQNPSAQLNVYRIDGVWFNTAQNWKKMNGPLAKNIQTADGVIYQSEFCREAAHKILGVRNKHEASIFNGVPASEFEGVKCTREKPFFVAIAKWRGFKRHKEAVMGFLEADLKDTELLVFGDPEDKVNHPRVVYCGWQGKQQLAEALVGCIASVHLSWVDSCPNSVVEALVAGKQVIHTTSGGTKHVVKGRGYVIQDEDWKMEPCDLNHVPPLDLSSVAQAYRKSAEAPIAGFDVSDLLIENVAKQYADFISGLRR